MKTQFFRIIVVLSLIYFNSCKKSADDKINGIWHLETILVDGVDSTQQISSDSCGDRNLKFLSDMEDQGHINLISYPNGPTPCITYAHYGFLNQSTLEFYFTSVAWKPIGNWGIINKKIGWNVITFTSSNLQIENDSNNIHTKLFFIKK